jgi:hypothetical protein
MKLLCKIAPLTLVVVFGFSGCKAKPVSFAKPYPVPPELPVNINEIVIDQYPLHVYWSQTLSERGYAQDRQRRINPPPQFEHFVTAFDDTVIRYAPHYNILQTSGRYIRWQPISERDFAGPLNPTKAAFYNAMGGGSFEDEIGPLMMLYDKKLVKAEDLTVVITDLEEQGLNNIKLAASVRNLLVENDSVMTQNRSSLKNAASVIVVPLPFNGVNYKPDPDRRGVMIEQPINGEKPLYLIVTGLRDPVAIFTKTFKVNAERNGIDCYIVSTIYPPDIESINASSVIIPQSASIADQAKVDKNKRVLSDLWNLRNTSVPERVWNLRDVTKSNMFEYFGVKDPLNLRILDYKTIGGGSKNGHRLWQLNVEFDKQQNLDLDNVVATIENYHYLAPAQTAEPAAGGKNSKKTAKSSQTEGVWENNNAILEKDLQISVIPESVTNTNRAQVYIVPRDKKKPSQQSSILYFEVVLQIPVVVPSWVDKFDDKSGGSTAGKTRGFYTFVEGILGIKPGEKSKALGGHELLRLPVVLTGLPARVQK